MDGALDCFGEEVARPLADAVQTLIRSHFREEPILPRITRDVGLDSRDFHAQPVSHTTCDRSGFGFQLGAKTFPVDHRDLTPLDLYEALHTEAGEVAGNDFAHGAEPRRQFLVRQTNRPASLLVNNIEQ